MEAGDFGGRRDGARGGGGRSGYADDDVFGGKGIGGLLLLNTGEGDADADADAAVAAAVGVCSCFCGCCRCCSVVLVVAVIAVVVVAVVGGGDCEVVWLKLCCPFCWWRL